MDKKKCMHQWVADHGVPMESWCGEHLCLICGKSKTLKGWWSKKGVQVESN